MRFLAGYVFFMLLTACAEPSQQSAAAPRASTAAAPLTSGYVVAEPLSGKRVRVHITARDRSLYIVNCNEHIVVALRKVHSQEFIWGGESNACLSTSIIIPTKTTLSLTLNTNEGARVLDGRERYRAFVLGVHQAPDVRSPQVAADLVTSNEFTLLP